MLQVKITDRNGLHARPACLIASIALKYKGKVYIEKGSIMCNAKSILSLMALDLRFGDMVNIVAKGKHSEQIEKKIKTAIIGLSKTKNS